MEWCCCFAELVWVVPGFFDFFFTGLFDDFFDFLVVLVGAVPVSGAMVAAPPVLVWA